MRYHITYRASFKKELRKLNAVMRRAVVNRILALAEQPRPDGAVKIRGSQYTYRIRQGDYRVVYDINDDILVVKLIKIGHRSDVYR